MDINARNNNKKLSIKKLWRTFGAQPPKKECERMVKEIDGRWWYCCPRCGKKLHPPPPRPGPYVGECWPGVAVFGGTVPAAAGPGRSLLSWGTGAKSGPLSQHRELYHACLSNAIDNISNISNAICYNKDNRGGAKLQHAPRKGGTHGKHQEN